MLYLCTVFIKTFSTVGEVTRERFDLPITGVLSENMFFQSAIVDEIAATVSTLERFFTRVTPSHMQLHVVLERKHLVTMWASMLFFPSVKSFMCVSVTRL